MSDPLHRHEGGHPANEQRLRVALVLVAAFMACEIVVAVLARSLAVWADAGHLLVDVGALAGALWAARVATRPPTARWTFGLKRAEILSAAANGVSLLVVGVVLAVEAIQRLVRPVHVHGGPVIAIAVVGVVVNLVAARVLAGGSKQSMNVHGAYVHVLTDLVGLFATAVAGVVIVTTGWDRADPLASLVVVVIVLLAAWRLLRVSGHVLLEGTPEAVDLGAVRAHIAALPDVVAVHDLHAWVLTSDLPAVTAHVVVSDACLASGASARLLDEIQACLTDHFDVAHSTFQLEASTHVDHETGFHG